MNKITLMQSENSCVEKIIEESKKCESDIFVAGELSTTNFPANDFFLSKDFAEQSKANMDKLKSCLPKNKLCIIGSVYYDEGVMESMHFPNGKNNLFSAALFFFGGEIVYIHRKSILSKNNYVDEEKYFSIQKKVFTSYEYKGAEILALFETETYFFEQYNFNFTLENKIIIIFSSEAHFAGKDKKRNKIFSRISKKHNATLVFINRVGFYEGYVFNGRSFIIKNEEIVFELPAYKEETVTLDLANTAVVNQKETYFYEDIYNMLIFSIKSYVKKLNVKKLLIGLSGGIDSALVGTLMAHSIGSENVIGVLMPSRFSSDHSVSDSRLLAKNLGMKTVTISIEESYNTLLSSLQKNVSESSLEKEYKDKMKVFSVAEENMQSRLRAIILMTLSNKYNAMVFSTGNRSEASMGYCTLYGDTCGSMLPIALLYKTEVYALSNYINEKFGSEVIPKNSITKEPSAELRENQKDQDSLPEYEILDGILKDYLDNEMLLSELTQKYDPKIAISVVKKYHMNEFKRRQTAIPIYIRDNKRKYPLT